MSGESWEDQTMRGNRLLSECQQAPKHTCITEDGEYLGRVCKACVWADNLRRESSREICGVDQPAQATAPDPWATVRTFDYTTYGDGYTEKDFSEPLGASDKWYSRGDYCYVEEVDVALAAERASHAAEIAELRQRDKVISRQLERRADGMDPLAQHLRELREAAEARAKTAETERQQLLDALKAVTAGMDRRGHVEYSFAACPWCEAGWNQDESMRHYHGSMHEGTCPLLKAQQLIEQEGK